ncbi:hypothetical protein PM082_017243 [Marasmius tenuissimus]|nr:hypothetical protein PM082_017243 [Marasmius tenuissimus]
MLGQLFSIFFSLSNPLCFLWILFVLPRHSNEELTKRSLIRPSSENQTNARNKPKTINKKPPRTFRWNDLPVELQREIALLAACQLPSTYRSLKLTCWRTNDLCPVTETIPFLPITLTTEHQIKSFRTIITQSPQFANRVRHLWIIPDHEDRTSLTSCQLDIIRGCPHLVSVACNLRSLAARHIVPVFPPNPTPTPDPFQWVESVKDLTVLEGIPWMLSFNRDFSFESLHIILGSGRPGQNAGPTPFKGVPCIDSLKQASISLGSTEMIVTSQLTQLFQSRRLERVAFTTRLPENKSNAAQRLVGSVVDAFGSRCSFHRCSRRLTEMRLWQERVRDRDLLWNLKSISSS